MVPFSKITCLQKAPFRWGYYRKMLGKFAAFCCLSKKKAILTFFPKECVIYLKYSKHLKKFHEDTVFMSKIWKSKPCICTFFSTQLRMWTRMERQFYKRRTERCQGYATLWNTHHEAKTQFLLLLKASGVDPGKTS